MPNNPEPFEIQSTVPDSTPRQGLPDLCHKCGRCCKSATTYHTPEKLARLAAEGNEDAVRFHEVFTPYDSIEAAREVVPEQVDQVLRVLSFEPDFDQSTLTFYHCKHVSPEGLCGIYETRPRFCKEAPAHGWSVMPPGCGFEGWQFEQREAQKAMIRELKNTANVMKELSPDGKTHPVHADQTIDALAEQVQQKISPWIKYGAEHW